MSDDNGKIILQGNVLENKIHHLPFRKQPNLQCDRDPSTNVYKWISQSCHPPPRSNHRAVSLLLTMLLSC